MSALWRLFQSYLYSTVDVYSFLPISKILYSYWRLNFGRKRNVKKNHFLNKREKFYWKTFFKQINPRENFSQKGNFHSDCCSVSIFTSVQTQNRIIYSYSIYENFFEFEFELWSKKSSQSFVVVKNPWEKKNILSKKRNFVISYSLFLPRSIYDDV